MTDYDTSAYFVEIDGVVFDHGSDYILGFLRDLFTLLQIKATPRSPWVNFSSSAYYVGPNGNVINDFNFMSWDSCGIGSPDLSYDYISYAYYVHSNGDVISNYVDWYSCGIYFTPSKIQNSLSDCH